MVVILSIPSGLAEVQAPVWEGITVHWTGWDGSEWDLAAGTEGVALQAGAEGMHDPTVDKFSSESRAVHGKRRRGWRAQSRDVYWPVKVYSDSSDGWNDVHRRFFGSMHPDKPGTWSVSYGGASRRLRLTSRLDQSHAYGIDPHLMGWSTYGVILEADQPFWEGDRIIAGPWKAPDSVSFIPPTLGPPFTISSSTAFGSAFLSNPGDVDAFPVWKIVGPLDDIVVGVGDALVDVPFAVGNGEILRIDTDPRNVTATLNVTDATAALGFQNFAAIPPAESVEVHVEATGSGFISCELVPLFFRAF